MTELSAFTAEVVAVNTAGSSCVNACLLGFPVIALVQLPLTASCPSNTDREGRTFTLAYAVVWHDLSSSQLHEPTRCTDAL